MCPYQQLPHHLPFYDIPSQTFRHKHQSFIQQLQNAFCQIFLALLAETPVF